MDVILERGMGEGGGGRWVFEMHGRGLKWRFSFSEDGTVCIFQMLNFKRLQMYS